MIKKLEMTEKGVKMSEHKYFLIPLEVIEGKNIRDIFYNQMCFLNLLQGKHDLIPRVKYCDLKQLKEESPEKKMFPLSLNREEINLLFSYQEDDFKEYQQELDKLCQRRSAINSEMTAVLQNLKYLTEENFQPSIRIPVPYFREKYLYTYTEIADELSTDTGWIKQLVKFYRFLTENNLKMTSQITAEDFIYNKNGSVKYFLNFNQFFLKKSKKDLLKSNLRSLAGLLNSYYLEDMKQHQARLFQLKQFERLTGRLITPVLHGKNQSPFYKNFQEILADIDGTLTISEKGARIGVFVDVANIFTALGIGRTAMRIDFNLLFEEIFGYRQARKIKKKIAVMFKPVFKLKQSNRLPGDLQKLKSYLEKQGFKVVIVENGTGQAKMTGPQGEFDIDDQKLIDLMEISQDELESILLFSGDRHFADILKKFQKKGQEVRVISASQKSTYSGLCENFSHDFVYDYPDCINLN